MTTVHFDNHRALECILAVVKYQQNYVSRGAFSYIRDGKPYGLVSQALAYGGVTIGQLEALDRQMPNIILSVPLPAGVTMTDDARWIFQAAQTAEDRGRRWVEALQRACDIYEALRRSARVDA